MRRHFLDPQRLLGGVLASNEDYELVHLSLLKGNEVPKYQNEAKILIFLICGRILLSAGERWELKALELVEIKSQEAHEMLALEDSQLLIIKVK